MISENSILATIDILNFFPTVPPENCIKLGIPLLLGSNKSYYHGLDVCFLLNIVLKQKKTLRSMMNSFPTFLLLPEFFLHDLIKIIIICIRLCSFLQWKFR